MGEKEAGKLIPPSVFGLSTSRIRAGNFDWIVGVGPSIAQRDFLASYAEFLRRNRRTYNDTIPTGDRPSPIEFVDGRSAFGEVDSGEVGFSSESDARFRFRPLVPWSFNSSTLGPR